MDKPRGSEPQQLHDEVRDSCLTMLHFSCLYRAAVEMGRLNQMSLEAETVSGYQ